MPKKRQKRRAPSPNNTPPVEKSRKDAIENNVETSPAKKLGKLVSSQMSPDMLARSRKSAEAGGCSMSKRKAKQKTETAISKYFNDEHASDSESERSKSAKVTVSRYFSDDYQQHLDEDSKKYLDTLSSKMETLSDSGSDTDEESVPSSSMSSHTPPTQKLPLAHKSKCDESRDKKTGGAVHHPVVTVQKTVHPSVAATSELSGTTKDDDADFEPVPMVTRLPGSVRKDSSSKVPSGEGKRKVMKAKDPSQCGVVKEKRGKVVSPDNAKLKPGKRSCGARKTARKNLVKEDADPDSDVPAPRVVLKKKRTATSKQKERMGKEKAGAVEKKSGRCVAAKGRGRGMTKPEDMKSESDCSESDEDDWEEVEEKPSPKKNQIPDQPVEVILNDPGILGKKRKGVDIETLFKRHWNKLQREHRLMLHKAHLLCLIAVGFRENSICSYGLLQAIALSCLPSNLAAIKPNETDAAFLQSMLKWFKGRFSIDADTSSSKEEMSVVLATRFPDGKVATEKELVFLLIIILRCLKINTRLVTSLQPIPLKPPIAKNKTTARGKPKGTEPSSASQSGTSTPSGNLTKKLKLDVVAEKRGTTSEKDTKKTSNSLKPKNTARRKCASKVANYKENDDADSVSSKGSKTKGKQKLCGRAKRQKSDKEVDLTMEESASSDSDFEIVDVREPSSKKSTKKKKKQKIVSSESDDSVEIVKVIEKEKGTDYWIEVYLEKEGKWKCVDCVRGTLDKPITMERYATKPLSYILAYDSFGFVRDVTARYASAWSTETRKLRIDEDWWRETVFPYRSFDETQNVAEDEALHAQLLRKPLPTSVAEYKNHPLYVLKRHLLKFQAIYPESAVPLGYVKGEPVYARDCVKELHSRDSWIKEARLVRVGEKPYKIVRGRKTKRNQVLNPDQKEQLLEVFGHWQTEEYMARPPVDGKLQKNEYGNIELFKPSMLPPGTVHLKLPGLNKIGKKLGLDSAPAMVGWEVHCGWSHPLLDGFIVCEEHKDLFIAAYDEEEEIRKEKERQKKEKRATENWKLLVKGLWIRERLKRKYDMLKDTTDAAASTSGSKEVTKATDTTAAWPALRQKGKDKMDKTNLLTFEKL